MGNLNKTQRRILYSNSITLRYLQYLSINSYFIILPIIAMTITGSVHLIKLSVSFFYLAYGFSQLFSGIIIEILGLKKSLFISILFFIFGSICMLFTQNPDMLIFSRIIQALGLGFIPTSASIIISQINAKGMPKSIMIQNLFTGFAPILAAILAGYATFYMGWKAIFIFFIIYATFLLMEIYFLLPDFHRQTFKLKKLIQFYTKLLTNYIFLFWVLSSGLLSSLLTIYSFGSVFIFSHQLHLGVHIIGWLTASVFTMLLAGGLLGILILKFTTFRYAAYIGGLLIIIGTFILFLLAKFFPPSIVNIVLPQLIIIIGYGIVSPTYIGALSRTCRQVSLATGLALAGAISAVINSLISLIMAHLNVNSALPMSEFLLIVLAITIIISIYSLYIAIPKYKLE